MAAREADIVFENSACWVRRDRSSYTVFRHGLTHATSDSAYKNSADGLSIAIARCKYLEKHPSPLKGVRRRGPLRGARRGSKSKLRVGSTYYTPHGWMSVYHIDTRAAGGRGQVIAYSEGKKYIWDLPHFNAMRY